MTRRTSAWRSTTPIVACGVACLGLGVAATFAPVPWPDLAGAAVAAVSLTVIGAVVTHRTSARHRATIDKATQWAGEINRDHPFEELPLGVGEILTAARREFDRATADGKRAAKRRRELELKVRVLDQQRRHLGGILNALSDAVLVTDGFGELAVANDAAARLLRFDLAGSIHKPIDAVLSDETLLRLIREVCDARSGSLRRRVEHEMTVDGETRCFEVSLRRIGRDRLPGDTALGVSYDPALAVASASGHGHANGHTNGHAKGHANGQANAHANGFSGAGHASQGTARDDEGGVVTILRDITRDKQLAAVKTDFVSRVSHELRTPLSSIKAYVEMLIDGEAHDETARGEFYDIIQSESERLSRLIDNILSISRIESGVVKVTRENLSLARLVTEAVDVILPQAQAKGISLYCEEMPLYFQVHADRDMVFQAIINLMSNAVKYTPVGGSVTVTVAVDEQAKSAEVAVSDTGAGIPREALGHVFDKFYRVKSHGKLAKGTGLGLALVKHVVERVHGGKVGVTSEVGQGSTFTITLPQQRR